MLWRQLLLTLLTATLFSTHALAQGHAHLLPPNNINPKGLSQGAQMWWFGPSTGTQAPAKTGQKKASSQNVDAANPNEDIAPGQSETAIGAAGNLVMAAWNDVTGFFIQPSTNSLAASRTGVGFSRDGGKSFTDLVGLPNNDPNDAWSGDPSVVAVDNGAYSS
ncbi:MAG: hypothetical protein JOY54_01020 [Acidobacteriaceae bacterium]|nr:hypothetical protein [Acidobacteriaceae bacterium]